MMRKRITILLLFFMVITVKSQENNITTFHRMLVFNKENKVLVVKIKNRDLWLTPGVYQNNKLSIKQGIDSIANTYGITVTNLKLRGVYGLKTLSKYQFSTRNIFEMKTDAKHLKLPENIDEFLWLDISELPSKVTIPHIIDFINDVHRFPNTIRAGTITRHKENGKLVSKISEQFYSLNP